MIIFAHVLIILISLSNSFTWVNRCLYLQFQFLECLIDFFNVKNQLRVLLWPRFVLWATEKLLLFVSVVEIFQVDCPTLDGLFFSWALMETAPLITSCGFTHSHVYVRLDDIPPSRSNLSSVTTPHITTRLFCRDSAISSLSSLNLGSWTI